MTPEKKTFPSKNQIPLDNKFRDNTLAGWHPPAEEKSGGGKKDAHIDMGWGKIIFAHTFHNRDKIISLLSEEKPGQRNIAFYLREPHVILSEAPQEIFLDPSHSYRLWLDMANYKTEQTGFQVRPPSGISEIKAVNEIYQKNGMVLPPVEFVDQNKNSGTIQYFIAVDDSQHVIGTITGVDHVQAYGDPEEGSSFWCLAVDPACALPGVGKALVYRLASLYRKRGRKYMDLSVLYKNRQAIDFYESLGFVRVPIFTLKYKNALNETLYTSHETEPELNPYAEIILKEARLRGIQTSILMKEPAFFELSLGARTVACNESLSDQTSAIAMTRCQDKSLTARILRKGGLRVPRQLVTNNIHEGKDFLKANKRVVLKPLNGEQGHLVYVDITEEEVFEAAFKQIGQNVLIEEFFEGEDVRVVVINREVVAAALRKPPRITGTGRHSVEQLIEKLNKRRQAATKGESKIPMDSETIRCVQQSGRSLDSILPEGETVRVRKTANLHTGGTLEDITGRLDKEIQKVSLTAADLLEIPVVGFDFMIKQSGEYCIIEANERPGLANHEPQPTARKFIDYLFPQTIVQT